MKPNLIITWIKHCDYSIFRANLKKYRNYFGKIIIYFNENNRFPYFDHFIQSSLSNIEDIIFIDQKEMDWGTQDWRNISTNEMLKYCNSDWIASWEQDWLCRDFNKLFFKLEEEMKHSDLIGWWQPAGKYIHPACWFMKREVLEKTHKDFGAHDGFDHFGWITQDVLNLGYKIKSLQDMEFNCDVSPGADCFHLGGVNQNYLEGLKPEYTLHQPGIFYVYNYFCRQAQVEQSPLFTDISLKIEERLKKEHSEYKNPEESPWKPFFT